TAVHLTFFFFSSRRRHTIFSRDWSSDVCSSDLLTHSRPRRMNTMIATTRRTRLTTCWAMWRVRQRGGAGRSSLTMAANLEHQRRSEERRVGKGGRSAWEPEEEEEKAQRMNELEP